MNANVKRAEGMAAYDPKTAPFAPFTPLIPAFLDGGDTPRDYLERCIEAIDAREAQVMAFVNLNLDSARAAADAAGRRYKQGRPASPIDGMPVGVKDIIETEDLPTEHGSKLFAGYQPQWDAACVFWLRRAGAVIIGKTVTTEFAARWPGPTRNPWDLERTPGGSSSGSAAGVASGMFPMGLGTQVRGSVLRPGAYCGITAIKPSFGCINLEGINPISRGVNHLGTLAASLEDAWLSLHYISRNAGGEATHESLPGKTEMPAPEKPARLIRLETPGWKNTPDDVRALLEGLLEDLKDEGIEIIDRDSDKDVDALETMFDDIVEISDTIRDWESRFPVLAYLDRGPELLSEDVHARKEIMENMTADDYAAARQRASAMRDAYAGLAAKGEAKGIACITLTASGPATPGMPTGDVSFLDPSSIIGAPALSLPLLAAEGLPLGVQMLGFHYQDARLIAQGSWLRDFVLAR
ncbi:MAG: amidase [Rhodospirillales bacterium]|jgi:Asp-tRNA(Asn)/Glu-tRNA(Gln) amidotransferase A subunit family amidase|nr:amidase [Rhodospirillaceae bacterium]MDP6429532.1 amidase [Rhodospirillales bacterium]MDP6646337.1 amidase [Rhodospirillales bacterium]